MFSVIIFNWLDWVCIGIFMLISIIVGIKYANRAGESLGEFFLSGRQLPWYVAGFSMVATTFAADTPLAVNEIVVKDGIAGNWLWWNFLIGGMLTVFFFAKYWRRAEIFSDVEFINIRYSGLAARALRGFKSIYLGIFINSIILGWVNVALVTILKGFFDVGDDQALYYVAAAMLITAVYSSISGLWGVAVTDFIQFIIAMTGCIVLAFLVVNSQEVGGIAGLKAKLPAESLRFFPSIGGETSLGASGKNLSITFLSFFTFIGIQWWSSWYPGAEPGGGGYVAQRMMSAKNEKHSFWATLFFQVANYCIRPWPWIMVGLCSIVLYPELTGDKSKFGYIYAMRDFLPPGLRGLLLVTFLAAYMSSVSSQLNWGASYIINDFYKLFIRKPESFKTVKNSEKHYVLMSRIYTIIAMLIALYATTLIHSISEAWTILMQLGSGLGAVLILRWYWWRINVWSEVSAVIAPGIWYLLLYALNNSTAHDSAFVQQLLSIAGWGNSVEMILSTTVFTSIIWMTVTALTPPESNETLKQFVLRIKPLGKWNNVYVANAIEKPKNTLSFQFMAWIGAVVMTYSLLFMIGKIIFADYYYALMYFGSVAISAFLMQLGMRKSDLL